MNGPAKTLTGIAGFDEITGGGLPTGRPTLVTGAAGSGKTLFGVEFLVRGARDMGEPGVLMSFEESAEDIAINVASLGFDLPQLEADGLIKVDVVRLDPSEIVVTGDFTLDGLLIRLDAAVKAVGAKRLVLDTIEVLFGSLSDDAQIRSELGRLFNWVRDQGLTAVITGERGSDPDRLTRYGIEEYVSDCVVALDQRVEDEISTRRLRVVKYRGSVHGTNEYPFLITARGLMVVPITSLNLDYEASEERIDTGVSGLDEMLGGGLYRGTAVMISGTAGTGKTTLAAQFAANACLAGERSLLISMEESPEQLIRNLRSVGIDLGRFREEGSLVIKSIRPTAFGFEEHLAMVHQLVDEVEPSVVVLDAVASLNHMGQPRDTATAIARDIDLMKTRGITTVLTTLMHDPSDETSGVAISSLIDTWLLLRNVEHNGERNRLLFVIKSRGSAHSNQVREYVISHEGAQLIPVFVGPDGVLTGSARIEQVALESTQARALSAESERARSQMAVRSAELRAQIAVLESKLAAETTDYETQVSVAAAGLAAREQVREAGTERRSGNVATEGGLG